MAEEASKKEKSQEERLYYALESDEVPKIYANGFTNFFHNADIGLILQRNGYPVAVVNMSYTLAKTLHKKLGGMIEKFEKESKQKIMTTDFIDNIITKKDSENT